MNTISIINKQDMSMRQIVLMLVLMMVGSEETRMPSLPVSMKKATYPAFASVSAQF